VSGRHVIGGIALVAALAGLALALRARDGGGEEAAPSVTATSAEPGSNYRVLSRAQSERLVAYAADVRRCLHDRGLDVAAPEASRTRIELAVTRPGAAGTLARAAIHCGDTLGGPPAGSSLQVHRPGLGLYVPRMCLLDEKVAAPA
jgi:hypothetical protein